MTPDSFRRLALDQPETSESAHMGHPDFRVRNKVFATLSYPGQGWAMVKLTPQHQASFVEAEPVVFTPVKGGWGRRGATNVHLKAARETSVRRGSSLPGVRWRPGVSLRSSPQAFNWNAVPPLGV
jgi:YjbR